MQMEFYLCSLLSLSDIFGSVPYLGDVYISVVNTFAHALSLVGRREGRAIENKDLSLPRKLSVVEENSRL